MDSVFDTHRLCYLYNGDVTITFDQFDSGTILTTQLQARGVIFNGSPGVAQVMNVLQHEFGVLHFRGSPPMAVLIGPLGAGSGVSMAFVLPDGTAAVTNFVSVRIGDGDALSESFSVSFYDMNDALLNAQRFTTTSGPIASGATVSFSGSGIHRVQIAHLPGTASGAVFDDLTFNIPTAPPPGSSQDNPILAVPVAEAPRGTICDLPLAVPILFCFAAVPSGHWFDPPLALGYAYHMLADSLFTAILDFPTGFNHAFTVSVDGIPLPGAFGPGETVDFDAGVSTFTITGISPLVDAEQPGAFPIKLAFNTPTASFTMQPILSDDSEIGPPTDQDQCKNGGWQRFNVPRPFTNQGDCIQFVNTGT